MRDSPDLERLVSELNETHDVAATGQLDAWLRTLVSRGGSDLLLVSGVPAAIRVEGVITPITDEPLTGAAIDAAVLPALHPHAARLYREQHVADASYSIPAIGRFRINLHRQRGVAAAAIRALPSRVPELSQLGLPPGVEALSRLPRGLVLIGGPAGSGKTTTLAALIHEINRRESRHILTIEDPIEYEHQHLKSVIEQVEIGVDAPDFPAALRSSLRQAPDVLVVGEMRDPETMHIAVTAAETGHLVLSTLHTTDVASTISRISDSFPLERQNTIRQELAMAISAVLTQALLRGQDGKRVVAAELLMISYGARQHIRRNALQHLHQEITITRGKGSFTLEESLANLVRQGVITRDDAALCANHPDDLNDALQFARK